jgi:hypothetical protein
MKGMDALKKKKLITSLKHFFNSLPYPIDKHTLLEETRVIAKGDDAVDLIEKLPNRIYDNTSDILNELEKIDQNSL